MDAFDVVVVGAGSAGAVIAAGLSDDPQTNVLLLEAGGDHDAAGAPAGVQSTNFFAALEEPGRVWPGVTATRAAGQSRTLYVRGRGAGGSSSVNAMCALRGTPDDYARWERELGARGWGWDDMRDAFMRVEDDLDFGGDGLHGRGGPIPLTRPACVDRAPFDRAIRTSLASLGHPVCDDFHAPDATGLHCCALTVRRGRRVSTNDAYLEPARGRPNLAVRGDTLVDRVLLDGRRAVGVRTADGVEIAARDVILCAGAIHSPAILLRSEIGVRDGLPVGKNLRDHAATPGFEVALTHAGRRTRVDAPPFGSMLRYSSGLVDAGPNDMQVLWFDAVGADAAGLAGARAIGAVMRVFSAGEVRLASSDPVEDPIVDFQMLTDTRDRTRLRDCVHQIVAALRHPAVVDIAESVTTVGASVDELVTDDAIDAWLADNVTDYVHAAGTCRMGNRADGSAVVDPACAVIGYEHVWVCDASVMPDIPRANTHLTVVAMADIFVHRRPAR